MGMGRHLLTLSVRGCRYESPSVKADHTVLEMPPPRELRWEIERWDAVWNKDLHWKTEAPKSDDASRSESVSRGQ